LLLENEGLFAFQADLENRRKILNKHKLNNRANLRYSDIKMSLHQILHFFPNRAKISTMRKREIVRDS